MSLTSTPALKSPATVPGYSQDTERLVALGSILQGIGAIVGVAAVSSTVAAEQQQAAMATMGEVRKILARST